ncbi:protein phosphatase 2C domain-containing protein [Streptomyces sp. NPDC059851]|uniref:protein phosphatase 2C domain-containing protein n=1 Tax=Streptomyces sp. NPDC059851 TaxID=3346971 RepID=UPI0036627F43
MHRLSGCPSCTEPLEEGDRFCGVCGSPVSAYPPPLPPDQPTLALPAPAATPPGGPAAAGAGRPATVPAPSPAAGAVAAGGEVPAAGGPADGYPLADPEPVWGGVAAAASWSSSRAGQAPQGAVFGGGETRHDRPGGGMAPWGADGSPYGSAPARREGPYDTPAVGHEDPYPAAAPAPEPRYGSSPEGAYGSPAGGGEPAHGGAPAAPEAPYGGVPAGREDPYGTSAPQGTGTPQGSGGKTCVACRAGRVDTDGYCEHCGHAQPRERDHVEEALGSVAAVSDRGLRHHRNEDSFAVAATALADGSTATVAIVCDGVSSASRPDDASAAAAAAANEALLDALPRGTHPQEAMHGAILAAAAAVTALAPEVPGAQNAPACTLVGAVVCGGLLTIGWVGDSRAYWVPDDRSALPRRLTEDDSWAAQMVAAGLMGEAEAYADVRAHAITGWLGADAYDLEPHTATFKPDHAGVVVVCTDGLWNYAESALEMARVLPADAAFRPLHSAQVLVGHALDGGGHDNVTVAVVPFTVPPGGEPEAGTARTDANTTTNTDTDTNAGPDARTDAAPEAEAARPQA